MKKYLLFIAIPVAFFACKGNESAENKTIGPVAFNAKAAADSSNYTSIQWLDSIKEIGPLNMGVTAEIKFRFTNTGNKPLFIVDATPGCGCTVADYPKEAIAPGSEGVITASFDTKKGSVGEFRKNIHVTTNTIGNTSHSLFFAGSILQDGKSTIEQPKPVAN